MSVSAPASPTLQLTSDQDPPVLWRQDFASGEPLARLAVTLGLIGPLVGRTDAQQHTVLLGASGGSGLRARLLADQGQPLTTAGVPRAFDLRTETPGQGETLDPELAAWAVRVRGDALLQAVRTRQDQAGRQGIILAPCVLELLADAAGRPAQIRVSAKGLAPRTIEILERVDPALVPAPTPPQQSVGQIGAAQLLTLGHLAGESAGVLVDPGHGDQSAHLAAVGGRGAVVVGFQATDPDLLESATVPRSAPLVLSPRLAQITGLLQGGVEELARQRAKHDLNQHTSQAMTAALVALLEDENEPQGAMQAAALAALGEPAAARLLSSTGATTKDSALDAAVAFARRLAPDTGAVTPEGRLLAETMGADAPQLQPHLSTYLTGSLTSTGKTQETQLLLARLFVAHGGLGTALQQRIAAVLAERDVQQVVGTLRDGVAVSPEAPVTRPELATALMQLAGSRQEAILDHLLVRVGTDPDRLQAFWDRVEAWQEAFALPKAWREDFATRRTRRSSGAARPLASWWRPSDVLRQKMASVEAARMAGTFGLEGATGRVTAGWADARLGAMSLADTAMNPDPAQYPLSAQERQAALRPTPEGMLRAELHADDLRRIGLRVSGMIRPDQPRGMGPDGRVRGPVIIGRWSADPEQTATRVTSRLQRDQRDTITPETAWVGDQSVALQRRGDQFPIARADAAGTLRLFAVDPWGERQVLALPLRRVIQRPEAEAITFAVEAADFERFCSSVAAGERTLEIHVGAATVQLRDAQDRSAAVLAPIGLDRLPTAIQAIAATAGVSAETPVTPLRRAIQQASQPVRVAPVALSASARADEESGVRRREADARSAPGVTDGAERDAPVVSQTPWVAATPEGAAELRTRDLASRNQGQELARLRQLLSAWPQGTESEVAAWRTVGGWGQVFRQLLADTEVRRHVLRSRAGAPVRELERLLQDAGQGGFDLEDTTLDLFAGTGGLQSNDTGALESSIQTTALVAIRRLAQVRKAAQRTAQDLEIALNVQMHTVRGPVTESLRQAPLATAAGAVAEREEGEEAPVRRGRVQG